MNRTRLAVVLLALGAMSALANVVLAEGQDAPADRVAFDIPGQPLSEALAEWARQSGLQVLHRNLDTALNETVSIAVTGQLPPMEALQRLLENTGLSYELINERTVRITPAPN